jgi:carbamoyl-phosphate synthase large subunit
MSEILSGTDFVPKTIRVAREEKSFDEIGELLGYPYWLRGSKGSSGLGSYKVEEGGAVQRWLAINPGIEEFVASSFLPGRNLACKLLYWNGKLVRTACAERINYIMAKISPSGITGNTSFGRLINSPQLVKVATQCMAYLCNELHEEPNGFFTVDFKEAADGCPKVTEINVRHVAFTSILAAAGANLAEDMVQLALNNTEVSTNLHHYVFEHPFVFLRDVDSLPILIKENDLLDGVKTDT